MSFFPVIFNKTPKKASPPAELMAPVGEAQPVETRSLSLMERFRAWLSEMLSRLRIAINQLIERIRSKFHE